jgi:hypothetical protein
MPFRNVLVSLRREAAEKTFEIMTNLKYLATSVTYQNYVREIKNTLN